MKSGFSIVLVFLILAAMFHITVARHLCGGEVAALKISLSGKLASCGMEGTEKGPLLPGTSMTDHCCDDVVISCRTDNNYKPSFSVVPETYQYNCQIFCVTSGYSFHFAEVLKSLSANESPPWALMSTYVDLSDICVFRI